MARNEPVAVKSGTERPAQPRRGPASPFKFHPSAGQSAMARDPRPRFVKLTPVPLSSRGALDDE